MLAPTGWTYRRTQCWGVGGAVPKGPQPWLSGQHAASISSLPLALGPLPAWLTLQESANPLASRLPILLLPFSGSLPGPPACLESIPHTHDYTLSQPERSTHRHTFTRLQNVDSFLWSPTFLYAQTLSDPHRHIAVQTHNYTQTQVHINPEDTPTAYTGSPPCAFIQD